MVELVSPVTPGSMWKWVSSNESETQQQFCFDLWFTVYVSELRYKDQDFRENTSEFEII